MNRKVTFLLLMIVLVAMGMVFFTQMQKNAANEQLAANGTIGEPTADRGGRVLPQKNASIPSDGEPSASLNATGDGAPKPVNLTTGRSPLSTGEGDSQAAPEGTTAATNNAANATSAEQAGQKTVDSQSTASRSTAPGLTPWKVTPKEDQKTAGQSGSPAKGKDDKNAQAKPQQSQTSEQGTRNLTKINLAPAGQNLRLHIEADGDFTYKAFVLTGPDRFVIDLPGEWKGMKAPSIPSNGLVKNVRIGLRPSGPRVVLDLTRPLMGHQVQRQNNSIEVLLQ